MPGNLAPEETALLERATDWLRSVLPPTWKVEIADRIVATPGGTVQIDGVINVTTPQGLGSFLVETKRNLTPKDAEQMFSGMARRYRQLNPYSSATLVVAPWLSSRTRDVLSAEGINYIDLTGNARIEVASPGLFLSYQGADRDPQPAPRGKARVRGPKAGRLVRFLCDVTPPYSVSEIALATRLTPGYVSRLLESLDGEALIERTKRGQVASADVPGLLTRWTENYDVFKTNGSQTFVARQGPAKLMQRFTDDGDIAITGSFAAVRLAPVAAPALLVAYARDVGIATAFDLLPADRGANVVLLRPFDEVVWERTMTADGVCYVSPSQVAADCLTGNGRMPSEGEALVTWMVEHQAEWRTPSVKDVTPVEERRDGS
ncbi:MAG: hypothetical protein ACLPUG_16695 [Acidimicrobiales bacterium]